jgi:hypothetical protein
VTEGQYARRKIFTLIGLYSPKGPDWANMGRSLVRGMLNSARGISDKDMSPEAQAARRISGFADLDGIEFVARIDIGTDASGDDKNEIRSAVTPDHRDYAQVMGAAVRRRRRSAAAHAAAQPARPMPAARRCGAGPPVARLGAVRGAAMRLRPRQKLFVERSLAALAIPRQHAGRGADRRGQDHHALRGHRRDDRGTAPRPACSPIATSSPRRTARSSPGSRRDVHLGRRRHREVLGRPGHLRHGADAARRPISPAMPRSICW